MARAALRKRGSLVTWLDRDMTWLAPHDGSPVRPSVFSDAAIQFCLTIQVLVKRPLRQTTGRVASLLKMATLDRAVPDDTTLCRRQKTLAVQVPYRRADGPLHLLVDIEPASATGSSEPARGHQVPRRWRVAGPQARCSGATPMAQRASGHRHGHIRRPSCRIHPQPRRRQPDLARVAGPNPRERRHRHRRDRSRCMTSVGKGEVTPQAWVLKQCQAERQARTEPHRGGDDLARKALAPEPGSRKRFSHAARQGSKGQAST